MNWTSIRSALLTAVQAADGIADTAAVTWSNSKESSFYRKFPRVDLSIRSIVAYGDDEARIDIDELDNRTEYLSGPRRFTLSIRVEGDSGNDALTTADRIRARLGRRDIYADLLAAEIAIADFADTQVVDYKADGRSYTVAILDAFVNVAENDTDDSDDAGETIEQVSAASEYVYGPDGEISIPNQFDLEVSSSG